MGVIEAIRGRFRDRDPWWAVYPTRRLAALVLGASVFWVVPGGLGTLLGFVALGAVIAAVIADWVMLPGRKSITVTREVPPVAGLGDPFAFVYVVESAWWTRAFVTLHHEVPRAVEAPTPLLARALAAGERAEIPVAAAVHKRGPHELGRAALRITTPLGLLTRIERTRSNDTMIVVPSLANVRRFRLLALHHRLGDAGIRMMKLRGEGQSLAGLREYVSGDDPRLVDWKATAKHGHLITREHTVERSQTVFTIIDCGRSMTQRAGEYSRLEHVLSAALLLTDVAATGGDQVGLLAFDDEVRAYIAPRRGRAALHAVREGVVGLGATMTEPDYAAAFRMLALRQRRRALVVFFTDILDARASRSLIAYLSRSAIRHAVVVVAIRNDELIEAARPQTHGALALYLHAAAEELIRERAEALARMRRAGVTVLDVSHAQMAPAVINRYLEIKQKGLL
jgi:uncharacterized protein (DUF58 family)